MPAAMEEVVAGLADNDKTRIRREVLAEICKMSKANLGTLIDEMIDKVLNDPDNEELKYRAQLMAEYRLRRK